MVIRAGRRGDPPLDAIKLPFVHYAGMRTLQVDEREVANTLKESNNGSVVAVTQCPLVVIPTYNERENIEAIVLAIREQLPRVSLLIIDDNSPDGTGAIADGLAERLGNMEVLHRSGKLGLGTAYIEGFRYALRHDYSCVFEMDADFSHDPRHLPQLLAGIERYDLVIGSRYVPGGATPDWKAIRKVISAAGNVFARNTLSLPVRDCTAGYKCYRRDLLAALDLDRINLQGYAFQIETVYQTIRGGFTVGEVPIIFPDRRLGHSKMSGQIVVEAFRYVVRRRWQELRRRRGQARAPRG
jgi:dolichol-phosphate mannosyltransferase